MPWMLQPKNYTQTYRPNLYNMSYRRVGAYKGMGRLHPSNYLEIGTGPNRIGGTSGQYNTLGGQLMLLPPSLRGLGQANPFGCVMPGVVGTGPQCTTDQILAQMGVSANQAIAQGAIPASVGGGANIIDPTTGQVLPGVFPVTVAGLSTNTLLMIGGGFLLLLLLTSRR